MPHVPAHPREVRELFDRVELLVDPLVVERIIELGASLDELCEAMDVDGSVSVEDRPPSCPRVAEVRALLAELLDDDAVNDESDRSDTTPGRGSGREGDWPPEPGR
jgi:hypothetical protein